MGTSKIDRIRALCEADPSNAFAWYSLAMEEKKTDMPAALRTFERVHTDHPKYVPNYYHYAQTLVTKSITQPGTYSGGLPHMRNREWLRMTARLRRLDRLVERLETLEQEVKDLKGRTE